ncbi:glycosyltransferase family 39 protein [Methylococcus capsulatus]|nr:glycosyltransferase family 39 protein [Methylococcus capsulatus]
MNQPSATSGRITHFVTRMFARWPLLFAMGTGALYAGLAYLIGSSYFFIYDDTALIDVADGNSVTHILHTSFTGFFRPLTLLVVKLEATGFGWSRPYGYILVSLLMHGLNATLLYAILRRLDFHIGAFFAATFFLLSPFATETFFWFSSQFDLLSALSTLLSIWMLLRYLDSGKTRHAMGAVLSYTGALFSKENAIAFVSVLLSLILWQRKKAPVARTAGLISAFLIPSAGYLAIRSALVGAFHSPYGNVLTLVRNSDIASHLASYATTFSDLSLKMPAPLSRLGVLYAGTLIAFLAVALYRRPRFTVNTLLLFCLTLSPVIWTALTPAATADTRFLYAPAIFLIIAISVGMEASLRQPVFSVGRLRIAAHLGTIGTFILLSTAALSTSEQAAMWRFAYETAHGAVLGVLDAAWKNPDATLRIRNLPLRLTEGPYLVKPYNLVHYAKAINRPLSNRLVCDSVILSYHDPELVISAGQSELGPRGNPNGAIQDIVIPGLPGARFSPRE